MTDEIAKTAVIQIAPSGDDAVLKLYEEARGLLKFAESRVIICNNDLVPATEDLSFIAKLKKAIEEKRKEYVSPIREHLDRVNNAFKEFVAPLDQADQLTRKKIMDFRQEQERKRKEAEAIEAEKLALAKREMELKGELTVDLTPIEKPEAVPDKVQTDMGTTGTMRIWKWEVLDKAAVPDEYKIVDSAMVTKVVKASQGKIIIPGIKVYYEDVLRVNTR